jgi:hypothetical protein
MDQRKIDWRYDLRFRKGEIDFVYISLFFPIEQLLNSRNPTIIISKENILQLSEHSRLLDRRNNW